MGRDIRLPVAAKDLLDRGFWIFPTPPGRRAYYGFKWSEKATNDAEKIEAWALRYPGCNWGVATGPSNLIVVDIDGKTGEQSIDDISIYYDTLPETLTARTPSGGRHLYYRGQAKNCTHFYGPGSCVDCRSRGGMVFAPGSVVEKGKYVWEIEAPIVACPPWLIDLIGKAPDKKQDDRNSVVLSENAEVDIKQAETWLEEQDPAIEGSGGEMATFAVMQMLRDFGLSVDKCAEIVLKSDWNKRCEPPWDYDELIIKATNAASYSHGEQGSRSLIATFGDDAAALDDIVDEDDAKVRLDPMLIEMNRVNSKLIFGDRLVYMHLNAGENGRKEWKRLDKTSFDGVYEHMRKAVPDRTPIPVGKWWREHPNHMRSKGFILDPDMPTGPTGIDKPFNFWLGWGMRPVAGDWSLYRRLVIALCDGCIAHADYVLDWCALLIQQPKVLPKVALVFRGPKGTGKSTLGIALMKILGSHAYKVDDIRGMTGNFNIHLKDKVFLLTEEIQWGVDRSSKGVLKSLITDPHKSYEPKRVDSFQGLNYISLMMTSNEAWVIPASIQDERRFAVFDVSSELIDDDGFWTQLYDDSGSLKHEPVAALFAALKERDISNFEPRKVPKTKALTDQAVLSLDFIGRWWHQHLEDGILPITGETWRGPVDLPTRELYEAYCVSGVAPRQHLKSRDLFGQRLKQFGVYRVRRRFDDGTRRYVYAVPAIGKARDAFYGSSYIQGDYDDEESNDVF
jgi:hypothetical protein